MKITVTTPCYQEIRFAKAWCENVLGWADEAIISEGGSTDGTREVLAEYAAQNPGRVRILDRKQPDNPQRYGFREGERRQELADLVTEGVQVMCDMDEMMSDDFRECVEYTLPPGYVGRVLMYVFWRSPNYIRVGAPGDEHWGPIHKHCVFPAGHAHWEPAPNHSPCNSDLPVMSIKGLKYHLHYLYGDAKIFENRILEYLGQRSNPVTATIEIRTCQEQMPKAFSLLEEHGRFADYRLRVDNDGNLIR